MADPKPSGAALPLDPRNPTSFPPPPPGPPPNQLHTPSHVHADPANPHHSNEAPIPAYNPAYPSYAPPPTQVQPVPHHSNEAPIPDYNPADPLYAPPPAEPYDDTPSDDEKRGARGKAWSQKLHQLGAKAAGPINSLANKMGAQSFLPTTMDKECEKAAKILKSFCKEGIETDDKHAPAPVTPITPATPATPGDGVPPKDAAEAAQKKKAKSSGGAIVKIPQKVLAKAVGLAIFTTARVGFQISGATGSGILVARLPDGTWSPPSGIQVHALGAGFMAGLDIYDCVCVINTREALAAFMDTRVSLGPEVAVAAGPWGAGGGVDFGTTNRPESRRGAENKDSHIAQPPIVAANTPAVAAPVQDDADKTKLKPEGKPGHHRRSSSSAFKPVFSYVKSRGLYAGIQVDGTVVTERKEANAAFYGEKVSVEKILKGDVPIQSDPHLFPAGAKVLVEALKRAEEPRVGEVLITPATAPLPATAPVHAPAAAPGISPASPSVPLAGPIYAPANDFKSAPGDDPPPYVEDQKQHPELSDQKTMYD